MVGGVEIAWRSLRTWDPEIPHYEGGSYPKIVVHNVAAEMPLPRTIGSFAVKNCWAAPEGAERAGSLSARQELVHWLVAGLYWMKLPEAGWI